MRRTEKKNDDESDRRCTRILGEDTTTPFPFPRSFAFAVAVAISYEVKEEDSYMVVRNREIGL